MWQLIAVILVSLNGAPVGSPEHISHPLKFDTEQACKDFEESDVHKKQLAKLLASEKKDHAPNGVDIATLCVPVQVPGTDI